MNEKEMALREQVKKIYVAYFGDCGLPPEEIDTELIELLTDLVHQDFLNVGHIDWRIELTDMLHQLSSLYNIIRDDLVLPININSYEKEK